MDSSKPDLSFASQGQYLLLNTASISWLSDRIPDDAEFDKSTMLYRFRENLLVEGLVPFEEMQWKIVKIGGCTFRVSHKIYFLNLRINLNHIFHFIFVPTG